MTTKSPLPEVWGTLSRKVLASVLVDDGAVIPVSEIIGNRADWFAPKERPIWRAVRECLECNTPPTAEAVITRLNGHADAGYIRAITNLFNDDDNRHLVYNTQQLRDLGVMANIRQLGRELSELDDLGNVEQEAGRIANELGGLMASKSHRQATAEAVSGTAWEQVQQQNENSLPSGLKWFDELTGGFWPGMNYWLVAPYKSGKSTVMRNSVLSLGKGGYPVGVLCAEGSREMFALDCQAMLATEVLANQGLRGTNLRLSGLFIKRNYWRSGVLTSQELEAVNQAVAIWKTLPIHVWDSKDGIRDLATTRYLTKRAHLEHGTGVFWADYSQLFGRGDSLFEQQRRTSLFVQNLAQDENFVFCMIAQQNEEKIRDSNDSAYSPGVKGGGDAASAADFMLIPRINPDEPVLELRLKLSRHSRTGKGLHYLNPSSGLLMDKWIDINTTKLQ